MIYYTRVDGSIVGGVAGTSPSDLQGITRLAGDAVYAIYVDDATVSSLNSTNQPGTYAFSSISAGAVYHVPTATGTLGFTVQPVAQQLANAQTAKIAQLQIMCQQTLVAGFTSSATGTALNYSFTADDQTNINQELTMLNSGIAVPFPINFLFSNGLQVSFATQAIFMQFCKDGQTFKWSQFNKLQSLIGQVQSATTVAQVNAITW